MLHAMHNLYILNREFTINFSFKTCRWIKIGLNINKGYGSKFTQLILSYMTNMDEYLVFILHFIAINYFTISLKYVCVIIKYKGKSQNNVLLQCQSCREKYKLP